MKLLQIIGIGVFAAVALTSCNEESKSPISVGFRGDASHSGISESEPVVQQPTLKWSFQTGGEVFGSAVSNGELIFIGSRDKSMYALDKETGVKVWSYETEGAITSTPCLSSDMVFFVSEDGWFYALDQSNGGLVWRFETGGERQFAAPGIHGRIQKDRNLPDEWDFYTSSPVANETAVFFGSGDHHIYALNKADGSLIWKYETGDVVHSSPALAFGKVYIGGWDSYFYALDAESGNLAWKYQTGIDTVYYNQTGIQSSPIISDSMVYFGCRDAYIYALNALDGSMVWKKYNNFSWINNTPIIYKDQVLYGTSDTYAIKALNKHTGDSLAYIKAKSYVFSSPTIAGNRLYIGMFNGLLLGMNLDEYKLDWSFSTDAFNENPMDVLKADSTYNLDVLFEGFNDYNNKDRMLEQLFSVGSILSTPLIDNQVIYFGSSEGRVYAIH